MLRDAKESSETSSLCPMMKEKITLSINPSYLCNLRCDFCYLSDAQLGNVKAIEVNRLFEKLEEVSTHRKIDHIDLYGGEVALLKAPYLNSLYETLRFFYQGPLNVITNLTVVNSFFLNDDVELSVSWDYFARDHHEKVYQNMQELKKDFHILILASGKLIEMPDEILDQLIEKLNALQHLVSVEVKPYSTNKYHSQNVSDLDFEFWIQKWIIRSHKFQFEFINEKKIKASLKRQYSSWSDEHLYITPEGKFAVLEFDELNREYFLEMENFTEYEVWSKKEKTLVTENHYCGKCTYLGSCLSEHLRVVKDLDQSCNGFRNLLSWYENERL